MRSNAKCLGKTFRARATAAAYSRDSDGGARRSTTTDDLDDHVRRFKGETSSDKFTTSRVEGKRTSLRKFESPTRVVPPPGGTPEIRRRIRESPPVFKQLFTVTVRESSVGTFVAGRENGSAESPRTLRNGIQAAPAAVTHSPINFDGRGIDHNVLFCSLVFLPAAFDSIRGCGESIYLSRCHELPVMDGGCSLTLTPEKGGRAKNLPVPARALSPPLLILISAFSFLPRARYLSSRAPPSPLSRASS